MHYVIGPFIAQMKEYLWLVVPQGINSDQADANFVGHIENLLRSYTRREKALMPFFSTTLGWLWGKSPDLKQRVLVVKTRVFSRVRTAKTLLAELDERKAISHSKEMQDGIGHGVQLNGAYSHCVPPFFFKSSKVNNQHLVALTSSLMS